MSQNWSARVAAALGSVAFSPGLSCPACVGVGRRCFSEKRAASFTSRSSGVARLRIALRCSFQNLAALGVQVGAPLRQSH